MNEGIKEDMTGGSCSFALTPELIDQIIFGMENQQGEFIMDAREGIIVPIRERPETEPPDSEEDLRYVPLPEWTSADGFQLMEQFVATLHNPVYRERLREALSRGKGVFRNFKNILKENEAVERLWFSFKESRMRARVNEWYEAVCEASRLERLGEFSGETETENLVLSDFVFSGDSLRWSGRMDEAEEEAWRENFPEAMPFGSAIWLLRKESWKGFSGSPLIGRVAETPAGELAGFIRGYLFGGEGENLAVCRMLYVERPYRGLGLADCLIDTFCEEAVLRGADTVLFEAPGRSRFLGPRLEERGFLPVSSAYALPAGRWKHRSEMDR